MVGPGMCGETLKNEKNEKHTLQDLDCGEKTEKRGKREMPTVGKCDRHTVGPGIRWETVKNVKYE